MTRPSWGDFATHDESAYPHLWDGVVGAWCPSLGPTGLRLHDHSRRNNWGTLTNMDPATDWVVSGGQYALDFDGVNDYVRVPANMPRWRAISAWVSLNTTGATQCIAESYGASAVIQGLLLYANSSGKVGFDGRDLGGTYRSSGASTTTVVGVGWVHLFGQFSDRLQIWVNGVKESETATALSGFSTTIDFNLGGLDTSGEVAPNTAWVNGLVDDVVLYNRGLTPNEVRQLYLLGRGGIYERRRRTLRRVAVEQAAAFKAYWARRNSQIIGGGV